ncbi:hypothetical protein [Nocardioides sp. BYT-33-1]|uniref:hypothetical protein n=1 Tax=Nocardioides sp. BYT-33-1 TaxID=3416952 RepID=UPI003F532BF1
MTTTTEDRFAALARAAMADVHADEALLDSVLRSARRRRDRRRATLAAGGIAAAAVLTTTLMAGGPRPVADDAGVATPASRPTAPVTAAALRPPTPDELDARLRAALPGPSTSLPVTPTPGRAEVRRAYDGGTVTALAYDGFEMFDGGLPAENHCDRVSGSPGPTGCTETADGWAVSSVSRPDVDGVDPRARLARVTYFRRDGLVIDLTATGSGAPVLSRDELVALATTADWFPAS